MFTDSRDEIVVDDEIRETVLLDMPIRAICRDNVAGRKRYKDREGHYYCEDCFPLRGQGPAQDSTSRDPDMVGAAYIVSQTLIPFIEAKYGPGGVRKMLDSYASGATAMDAIPALAGTGVAEFNTAFRQWGKSEKRVFENTIPVRYDTERHEGTLRFSKEKRP